MTETGGSGRSPRKAPVMADVAKLAGVSHQTVSRVINRSDHVKDDTIKRVLDAMQMLDYRPNPVARALATGKSKTLGIVSFNTTLYGPASDAFWDRARGSWRGLLRQHRQPLVARPQRPRRGRPPAGPGRRGNPRYRTADCRGPRRCTAAERHPCGCSGGRAGRRCPGRHRRSVRRAELATRHLLDLGHHSVWTIAGPGDWLEAQQRIAGWRATLESAGSGAAGARWRLG